MTPRRNALVLFVALAVTLIPTAAISATTTVSARTTSWGPARPTIERGDTVRWSNTSGGFQAQDHTVTSYRRNWSKDTMLPVGATTTKRFTEVGIYKFRCVLHSSLMDGVCQGMCGVVKVVRPT